MSGFSTQIPTFPLALMQVVMVQSFLLVSPSTPCRVYIFNTSVKNLHTFGFMHLAVGTLFFWILQINWYLVVHQLSSKRPSSPYANWAQSWLLSLFGLLLPQNGVHGSLSIHSHFPSVVLSLPPIQVLVFPASFQANLLSSWEVMEARWALLQEQALTASSQVTCI